MESRWLFLSVDELLYRFHIYIAEPVISFFTFEWWRRDSSVGESLAAQDLGIPSEQSFFERWFADPVRLFVDSLPSRNAGQSNQDDYFPPQESEGVWGVIREGVFGSANSESLVSIIFGSFLGWILILAAAGLIIRYLLKEQIHFMEKRQALLYDMANTGHVQNRADDKRARWEMIVQQVNSDDVNQWKIAVLDADSLLDDVLYEQGYGGDGVAAKLQAASRDNFDTVRYAQEAHGVRNRIAHDAGYAISHREAKLAIASYERFFNELYHL